MNNKKEGPLFGIGSMILLTVLLVLCLTIFAVLTLSSAQADWRLSEKNARTVSAYYAADTQAVRLMADAEALWQEGQNPPDSDGVMAALGANYTLFVVESTVGGLEPALAFYCDIPVDDLQILRLELYLMPPSHEERWQTRQWQIMKPETDDFGTEFLEEQPLPVWQGE